MCKESFLDDVVKVSFYRHGSVNFPIPVNVSNITSFSNVVLGTPAFTIAINEDTDVAATTSISVKQTPSMYGSIVQYIYNVDATISDNVDAVASKIKDILVNDYYAVCETAGGDLLLLYTLPNTFSCESASNISSLEMKVTIKSVNGFIPLTLSAQ